MSRLPTRRPPAALELQCEGQLSPEIALALRWQRAEKL